MIGQELTNTLGLMGREIIGNDMDLPIARLTRNNLREKCDKLFGRMALRGSAVDFTGLRIQRCIQRQCSMAIVFKPVTFSAPWRKGQHWIQSIQSLDGSLFVDTKHSGVLRRTHV